MLELSAVEFILSSAKFLVTISTDEGTFFFILLFIGFNVENYVGINESSVPLAAWILGVNFVLCVLKVQIWWSTLHFSSKKFHEEPNGCRNIESSVLLFLLFTLETDVEFDEGSHLETRPLG